MMARAFTLIETLVVLLIIAIIIAVTTITFHSLGKKNQKNITAQQFSRVKKDADKRAFLLATVIQVRKTKHGYKLYRYWPDFEKGGGKWKIVRA